jgi:sugar phosphate isomerase/epimerase
VRYGVCNWIFGNEELATTAAFLAGAGFDGLELAGSLGSLKATEVNAILGDHGLEVLSLTPDNVDLAHPYPGVRVKAVNYYLRLLEFAAAVGAPLISCHGAVGRVRPLASQQEEYGFLVAGVQRICEVAADLDLLVAMEVLNRYESHLLNTAAQAVEFVSEVGAPSAGILLDAYHMNIEEADPAAAILTAGDRLLIFHVADSNRQAIGRGHTDFPALVDALRQVEYAGDVIFEGTAAGPDPFTPVKGEGWRDEVRRYAQESLQQLKALEAAGGEP